MRWLCSAVRCWRRDLKSALLLRLLAFRAAVRCMAVRRRRAAQGLIAGPITKSTIILAFGGAFDSAAVHIAGPCLAVGVVHPTHFGAHKRGHLDAARCGEAGRAVAVAVGSPTLAGRAMLGGVMVRGHPMLNKAGCAGPRRGLACAPTLPCLFLCPSRAVRAVLCSLLHLRGRAHPIHLRRHQPSAGAPNGRCGGAVSDRGGAVWALALQSGAA